MHLDQPQLRKLTDYMGYKMNVHLDFYSLSNDIVQKEKLSKNKDFDDIEIDDEMYSNILNEEAEEDDENEDNSVTSSSVRMNQPIRETSNIRKTREDHEEKDEDNNNADEAYSPSFVKRPFGKVFEHTVKRGKKKDNSLLNEDGEKEDDDGTSPVRMNRPRRETSKVKKHGMRMKKIIQTIQMRTRRTLLFFQ